jgi:hypothetical protein
MSGDSPENVPPGESPESEYEVSQMRYMSDLEHVRDRACTSAIATSAACTTS